MIKSSRVVLRGKTHRDLDNDYSWRVDPDLVALDAAHPLPVNQQQFAFFHKYDVDNTRLDCAKLAIDMVSGQHIGNCVFYNIEFTSSRCEYGIMIGQRDYWNQGIGSEVTRLAVNYVFKHTDLRLLYLHTLTHNERAIGCFSKCGFETVGELERDGYQFLRMELTAERFAQLNQTGK